MLIWSLELMLSSLDVFFLEANNDNLELSCPSSSSSMSSSSSSSSSRNYGSVLESNNGWCCHVPSQNMPITIMCWYWSHLVIIITDPPPSPPHHHHPHWFSSSSSSHLTRMTKSEEGGRSTRATFGSVVVTFRMLRWLWASLTWSGWPWWWSCWWSWTTMIIIIVVMMTMAMTTNLKKVGEAVT